VNEKDNNKVELNGKEKEAEVDLLKKYSANKISFKSLNLKMKKI